MSRIVPWFSGVLLVMILWISSIVYGGAPRGFGDSSEVGTDTSNVEFFVPGATEDQEEGFLDVVRGWVNWVLGILALVALIMLIYGGIVMVTAAGNQETYQRGWKFLKAAAVWLIIIGVAWFIISLVFWLINLVGEDAGAAWTDG